MTIHELETAFNLDRANIRFYEKAGLLNPKRNPINDYREYSKNDVETLKRILLLRSLNVSIESIRQLQQSKISLQEVLFQQQSKLKENNQRNETMLQTCELLLKSEELTYEALAEVFESTPIKVPQMKDTLHELWFFWDKLVVWGFLALQLLYTLSIFSFLPDQIPTHWDGLTIIGTKHKIYIFYYVLISFLIVLSSRYSMFYFFSPFLLIYADEINAILSVGIIGFFFSLQIYTVLTIQGMVILQEYFLLGYALLYLLSVLIILWVYRSFKRKMQKESTL